MRLKTFEDNSDGHISACYASRTKPISGGWFIGGSGIFWHFSRIGAFIQKRRKDLLGKPALSQLKEIGLLDDFDEGVTPCQIPRTLAVKESGWN